MRAEARIENLNESNGLPSFIRASWTRCEEKFGLVPDLISKADVITSQELKDATDRLDRLIFEAALEMRNIYMRLRAHDYLITLTNNEGITLQSFIPPKLESDARVFALYNGSIWGESFQGTNGVGTAIQLEEAVSVVQSDHFSKNLTGLTCTAAPILDAQRRLAAVLNVTTPRDTTRQEQAITMQIVKQAAKRIENMWFLGLYRDHSVLQVANVGSFADLANGELLAIDKSGLLIASTLPHKSPLSPKNHSKQACNSYLEKVLGLSPTSLDEVIRKRLPLKVKGSETQNFYVHPRNISSLTPNCTSSKSSVPKSSKRKSLNGPDEPTLSVLAGQNPQLLRSISIASRAFEGGLPILFTGETGTGKGAFAKALHLESSRADKPFVPLNCAAIPEDLFESILFGYLPGAFTGAAREGSQGSVLDANGGTLFLDEIGDMPLNSQVRLLRVLSEREVTPLGSSNSIRVDVNVVSATLHDLEARINEGAFRRDLYYRIASVEIDIPALYDRADKHQLIKNLCASVCANSNKSGDISDTASRMLADHVWKGNFRELISVLRYAVVLDTDDMIDVDDLPDYLSLAETGGCQSRTNYEAKKRTIIESALANANGNVSKCARQMGVSRSTLYRNMSKLGII